MIKMTSRVKVKMVTTIVGLLALCIVSSMYLMKLQRNIGNAIYRTPQPYIMLGLIVLAVISVVVLILKNKGLNQELIGEYAEYYGEIIDRLDSMGLESIIKSEIRDETHLLLCDLQADGRKIEDALGEKFLEDMIYAYGKKNSVLNDFLTGVQFFIAYMFMIQFLMRFKQGVTFFNAHVDVSTIAFFFLMSFVAIPIIYTLRRKALTKRFRNYRYIMVVLSSISIALLFIVFVEILESKFSTVPMVDVFLNESIIVIGNIFTMASLSVVVFLIQWKKVWRS